MHGNISNYQKSSKSGSQNYVQTIKSNLIFDIVVTVYHLVIYMQSNKKHKVF